ncbi:hypothetical protein KHA80_06535 [Anaerobacillus sp. HL2]|nr:hypothetical protein KHA80_06535 [Anaerobacillus sp. HL2]
MRSYFEKMDKRFDMQDEMMKQIITIVGKTNERLDATKDVSEIKESILRVEQNVPEDILGMLKQMNAKLDEKAVMVDYSAISEKVADLEADLKLVKKVITNQ